jgi:hypothetical protein
MSERIATPVVKNKFWVVEEQGEKIATIQARDDGGIVYVHDDRREYFDTVSVLKKKYNIKFGGYKLPKQKTSLKEVYGFPVSGKSYNEIYDIQNKLPLYTKTAKSKSKYCAGYYLVNVNNKWNTIFCPKSITLSRYEFLGPYRTEKEQLKNLTKVTNHAKH